jgi:hypothetical protein
MLIDDTPRRETAVEVANGIASVEMVATGQTVV